MRKCRSEFEQPVRGDGTRSEPVAAAAVDTIDLPLRIQWWMNPIWPALLLMTPLVAYALTTEADQYSVWRVKKYFDADTASTIMFGVIALAVGVVTTAGLSHRRKPESIRFTIKTAQTIEQLSRLAFALMVFSYVCWIGLAIRGGLSLDHIVGVIDLERGAVSRLKDVSSPVGGLTTFTQLGSIVVVLEIILLRAGVRGNRRLIAAVLLFAGMRALFYGERLSLIEVLVPLAIVCLLIPKHPDRRSSKNLSKFAPILALPALWLVFALFEYSRSWLSYRTRFDGTYPEYVTQRLVGYYVTALNNSALFIEQTPLYGKSIFYSFSGVWDAPGASALIGVPRIGDISNRAWWRDTLESVGNPEFNNPGSFGVTFAEMGWFGTFFFWCTIGLILGSIYSSLRNAQLVGLVALPCVFIGLIEMPRIIYWTQGRFVPAAAFLILIAYMVHRKKTSANIAPTGFPAVLPGGVSLRTKGIVTARIEKRAE